MIQSKATVRLICDHCKNTVTIQTKDLNCPPTSIAFPMFLNTTEIWDKLRELEWAIVHTQQKGVKDSFILCPDCYTQPTSLKNSVQSQRNRKTNQLPND